MNTGAPHTVSARRVPRAPLTMPVSAGAAPGPHPPRGSSRGHSHCSPVAGRGSPPAPGLPQRKDMCTPVHTQPPVFGGQRPRTQGRAHSLPTSTPHPRGPHMPGGPAQRRGALARVEASRGRLCPRRQHTWDTGCKSHDPGVGEGRCEEKPQAKCSQEREPLSHQDPDTLTG